MSRPAAMNRVKRAERHRELVRAYQAGQCSRCVARMFGLSDGHVRAVVRLYGVARRQGRPLG